MVCFRDFEHSTETFPRFQVRFVETAAAFGAFRRNRYGAESDIETEIEEASSASSREEPSDTESEG